MLPWAFDVAHMDKSTLLLRPDLRNPWQKENRLRKTVL